MITDKDRIDFIQESESIRWKIQKELDFREYIDKLLFLQGRVDYGVDFYCGCGTGYRDADTLDMDTIRRSPIEHTGTGAVWTEWYRCPICGAEIEVEEHV